MLNPRRLRHNDIVMQRDNTGWAFFGRVWRRHDENHVEVVDCGKYVQVYHEDELILSNDYKGYERSTGRFLPMTSLRQLKINAARYNAHFGRSNAWGRRWTRAERQEALANPTRYEPR